MTAAGLELRSLFLLDEVAAASIATTPAAGQAAEA
jgi:hypothetical protein